MFGKVREKVRFCESNDPFSLPVASFGCKLSAVGQFVASAAVFKEYFSFSPHLNLPGKLE